MKINRSNPYESKGRFWLRGNLHTHTDKSACGRIPAGRVVELFAKNGFDFLALSDHYVIFDQNVEPKGMIILPGIEVDNNRGHGHHKCIINTSSEKLVYKKSLHHQALIDRNAKNGAIITLNHPDWQHREHYTIDELRQYRNYTGIEIYNSVIERLDGSPLSTAKWDRLLASGHYCFGFASQDFHDYRDLSEASIMVSVKRKTAKDILESIKAGNFYSFLGVHITKIARANNTIAIKTKNANLIRFIGFGGTTLKKIYGKSGRITFDRKDPKHQYIRVECVGDEGNISWSQPFVR